MKPSVTKLISLLDKPALMKWANKIGLEGIELDQYRSDKMNEGTSIHSQIEGYIKHGEPFINELHEMAFKKYISGKEILGYENNIETEWFIGRYDLKIKFGEKIYLVDFKSNAKGVYFENKLQLVAYGMAENCDGFCIVSVPSFSPMYVDIKDRTPYEEIMKSLSSIYKCKSMVDELK